jgi:DNA recombination protein RmuC
VSDGIIWILLALTIVADVLLILLLLRRSGAIPAAPDQRLDRLVDGQERLESALRDEMGRSRNEIGAQLKDQRVEVTSSFGQLVNTVGTRLDAVRQADEQRQENLRAAVETRLKAMQEENSKSLEQVRIIVDQKLQATLEQRLGESFKMVGEHLESVHKGLGEMQALASGVGDLRKVLTNVKVRGTWGEAQLGNMLAEILAPEQYSTNVATRKGSADRVEYAIRLPGRDAGLTPVWLPVDAKFPQEDFQRLMEASERADAAGVETASKALDVRLRAEAKDIRDKYLDPPNTTDFAILYLPIESLFAEVLRRPGLSESLQRDFRVVVAGPTTFAALLNSLHVGFRTLAIEHRSAEVWHLLGAVKTEFAKFGDALDKVQKKIGEAGTALEKVGTRSRVLGRRLKDVEAVTIEDPTLIDDAIIEEDIPDSDQLP